MKPQTMSKRHASPSPTRSNSEGSSSGGASSDEELVIHKKKDTNGFHRPASNTREEDEHHSKLKDVALDVKSDDAKKRGDFKSFNLPKELIEKLKG